jgi:hypothetical protein
VFDEVRAELYNQAISGVRFRSEWVTLKGPRAVRDRIMSSVPWDSEPSITVGKNHQKLSSLSDLVTATEWPDEDHVRVSCEGVVAMRSCEGAASQRGHELLNTKLRNLHCWKCYQTKISKDNLRRPSVCCSEKQSVWSNRSTIITCSCKF